MSETSNTQRGYAAIGKVCVYWADIEWLTQRISELTAPFLALEYRENTVSLVLTIALAHMDIRNKVATAKVLLSQANIDGKLARKITALLNVIDNELRNERNRYIHDEWIIREKGAARSTMRPKVVQEQAHKTRLQLAHTQIYGSFEDLERFGDRLSETTSALISFCDRLEAELEQNEPLLRSAQRAAREKPS